MLSGLLDAVDAVDVAPRGDDIAAALKARDLLDAKIAAAVGVFDHAGDYALDAATSTVAWLRTNADLTAGEAASLVRTSRRVRQLPVTGAAWLDGRLSGGQVQAIVHNVDDSTLPVLQADEAALVPYLVPLDAHDTAVVMRDWRHRADALVDRPEPKTPERSAHLSTLLDGRGRLDADLDAEAFKLVQTALRLAMTRDGADDPEPRPYSRRVADALVDVFRSFLDHHTDVPATRVRPHVNIVLRYEDIVSGEGATYDDGTPADPTVVKKTMCDANINRVVANGRSVILDQGRSTRLYTDAQFAALVLRDRHCRFKGCDRPPWWTQAHHVVPWEEGGATDLANGVLACDRHHHILHLPGWTAKLEPDGTFHVTNPDGTTWTTTPPGVLTFDA